ncbi:environmental stress-induced protein Ves [Pseudarthrobacter oxydans]|uniref:HutD/Ves family protein n=1 Tax=Pseudarthrobacter oxydans TaxID=1671 RepID=UPI0027896424|nr:HutD family protein [Pseudarthrobacter oxydans]MDP9984299.1 environmental stress-induced protein Ves [Pseudarthrobacter oxydans]
MEIIRYAELKAHPWRNGGGVTRELASHPAAAPAQGAPGQDAPGQDGPAAAGWDWRVSIAEVSKAGDFSAYPGMDRVLTVVEGELLLLSVDGAEHPLEKYRPFRFSGDAAATGALPTGDIRDLNVITRQGVFKGYTSIIELSKKRAHPVFEGQFGILLQGQAAVTPGTAGTGPGAPSGTAPGAGPGTPSGAAPAAGTAGGSPGPQAAEPTTLARYDAVVGSDTDTPEILGRGFLAVVSIDRVAD